MGAPLNALDRGASPSRWLALALLRLGVSVAVIGGLLIKLSPARLADSIRGAEPIYLAWAGLLLLLVEGLVIVKWRILTMSRGLRLPGARLAHHFFVGNLLTNVLPTSVGGDVYRIVRVQRDSGGSVMDVTLTVVYERATGYAAMASLGAVGAAFHFAGAGAGVGVLLSFPVAFLVAALLVHQLPAPPLAGRLRSLVRSRADVLLLLRLTGFSALIQAAYVSVIGLVGKGFGVEVGWWYWATATAAVALATLLPVSFGGLGIRESGYAAVLAPVGARAAAAASVGFTLALLLTLVSLLGLVVLELAARVSPRWLPARSAVQLPITDP